jgi:hypothetical protein
MNNKEINGDNSRRPSDCTNPDRLNEQQMYKRWEESRGELLHYNMRRRDEQLQRVFYRNTVVPESNRTPATLPSNSHPHNYFPNETSGSQGGGNVGDSSTILSRVVW